MTKILKYDPLNARVTVMIGATIQYAPYEFARADVSMAIDKPDGMSVEETYDALLDDLTPELDNALAVILEDILEDGNG